MHKFLYLNFWQAASSGLVFEFQRRQPEVLIPLVFAGGVSGVQDQEIGERGCRVQPGCVG